MYYKGDHYFNFFLSVCFVLCFHDFFFHFATPALHFPDFEINNLANTTVGAEKHLFKIVEKVLFQRH